MIIKQIANNCAMTIEQLSDRIDEAKRTGGKSLTVQSKQGVNYWLPIKSAYQVLEELYLK